DEYEPDSRTVAVVARRGPPNALVADDALAAVWLLVHLSPGAVDERDGGDVPVHGESVTGADGAFHSSCPVFRANLDWRCCQRESHHPPGVTFDVSQRKPTEPSFPEAPNSAEPSDSRRHRQWRTREQRQPCCRFRLWTQLVNLLLLTRPT